MAQQMGQGRPSRGRFQQASLDTIWPEMSRALGRQGLSKGSVVHLAIVKEAGTLCWAGNWHMGTCPGDLGSVDPSPAWALSSLALMAFFSVCSKPHSGIQTQNGGISARQMI